MRGLRAAQLLAVTACLLCVAHSPVMAEDGHDPLVLALYYAWYDWAAWSRPTCDLPATLYVSADESAVERHVQEARGAGIDALVEAWYGPTLGDNLTEPNLRVLLDEAAEQGLKVAILVDMTGTYLSTPTDVSEALVVIRDQHAGHSAYLAVEGRPVVFFLGQQAFPISVWEAVRSGVDPDHQMIWIAEGPSVDVLSVFDGLYLYDLQTADPPGSLDQRWGQEVRTWDHEHGASRYWVATVMPGYDDSRSVGEEDPVILPRHEGEMYRDGWAAAQASDPDWMMIRSFNDWVTCTHIEPSLQFGHTYLDLTAELIGQLSVVPVDTPTPTATIAPPTATPTEASILVTATATVTPTLTPTPSITPTATLAPTATPFRLATPTIVQQVTAPVPTDATRSPELSTGEDASDISGRQSTATPMPRLTVEGGRSSRCSFLPFLMAVALCLGARGHHDR